MTRGDPNVAGVPFVIRIENVDGQIVFPYWHPEHEHLVVVQGTWSLGAGDRFSRSSHRPLTAGPSSNLAELFGYPWVVNGEMC